jgi:hypothetical protein
MAPAPVFLAVARGDLAVELPLAMDTPEMLAGRA